MVGVRESAVLAAHMAYYLNYIVDDVVLITSNSSNEIIEGIYKISKKDVMIGISFPNYSYNVLKAMEYANTRQANIIAKVHVHLFLEQPSNIGSIHLCLFSKLLDGDGAG